MFKSIFVICFIVGFGIAFSFDDAFGHGIIDQRFEVEEHQSSGVPGGHGPYGQTFIPTVNNLVGLDVPIDTNPQYSSEPVIITATIYAGTINGGNAIAVSENEAPLHYVGTGDTWVHFDFPNAPIPLFPGTTYTILLTSNHDHIIAAGWGMGSNELATYDKGSRVRPDGVPWYSGTPATTPDQEFRTYFVELPKDTTITVKKIVINDNIGTSAPDDFILKMQGPSASMTVINGEAVKVPPGTYTIIEENAEGYNATFRGDCDSDGVITIESEQQLICTITNDDIGKTPSCIAIENGRLVSVTCESRIITDIPTILDIFEKDRLICFAPSEPFDETGFPEHGLPQRCPSDCHIDGPGCMTPYQHMVLVSPLVLETFDQFSKGDISQTQFVEKLDGFIDNKQLTVTPINKTTLFPPGLGIGLAVLAITIGIALVAVFRNSR